MANYSGYHLSDNAQLCVESPSLKDDLFGEMAKQHGILATHACHIAEFLKPSHRYLHQLSWTDAQILNVHEEGHHDGASDFSTLEYVLLSDATLTASWDLHDPAALQALSESAFVKQLHSALMGSPAEFVLVLVQALGERLNREWLGRFQLTPTVFTELLDRIPTALLRNYVTAGLLDSRTFTHIYDSHLFWAGQLVKGPESASSMAVACRDLFDTDFQPQDPALKQAVARFHFVGDSDWQRFLATGEPLNLNEDTVCYYQENHSTRKTVMMLADTRIHYPGDTRALLQQALATGLQHEAVALLKSAPVTAQRLDHFICQYLAIYGTLPRFAFDPAPYRVPFSDRDQDWADRSLKDLCITGDSEAVSHRLHTTPPSLSELNSALQYAADEGYAHIVRLLHDAGAELDTWNHYAIKTATSKGFVPLLRYLESHGASRQEPENADNEWGL